MYVPRNSNREMQALRATTLSQLENQEKANKIVKTMGKKQKKIKKHSNTFIHKTRWEKC